MNAEQQTDSLLVGPWTGIDPRWLLIARHVEASMRGYRAPTGIWWLAPSTVYREPSPVAVNPRARNLVQRAVLTTMHAVYTARIAGMRTVAQ